MTTIVGCLGQKGGSGKSTTARLIAVATTRAGMPAFIADMDHTQKTSHMWSAARVALRADLEGQGKGVAHIPRIACGIYDNIADALAEARTERHAFFMIDAPGRTGPEILQIAKVSDVVVLPCNPGADDLTPTIKVYKGLLRAGIEQKRIIVLLNHIGNASEEEAARQHLANSGVETLPLGLKEKVVYRSALTQGLSPTEVTHKGSKAEAEAVVKQLLGKIIEANDDESGRVGGEGGEVQQEVSAGRG